MDYNDLFQYHENGTLTYKASPTGRFPIGHLAGSLRNDGYVGIYIGGVYYFAHRIVWQMHNGEIPDGLVIDHINRIRNDNRLENLRTCTFQENHFNRIMQSNNKSGYKGVSWHKQKGKWVAQIKVDGRNKFLGFFSDAQLAHAAYCAKAAECYGEFAKF